jgi:hypothetical protein
MLGRRDVIADPSKLVKHRRRFRFATVAFVLLLIGLCFLVAHSTRLRDRVLHATHHPSFPPGPSRPMRQASLRQRHSTTTTTRKPLLPSRLRQHSTSHYVALLGCAPTIFSVQTPSLPLPVVWAIVRLP